ncbi:hypothetical protein [Streptomyces laurentii]
MEQRFVPPHRPGERAARARVVHDVRWARDAGAAAGCAGLLLVVSLAVEALTGGPDLPDTLLWAALSGALFVVLLPARVVAAPGRVSVRGVCVRRTVRTDRLAALRWSDGIERGLDLRDTDGGHARIELRVLLANPRLWLLLETDARACAGNGTLLKGIGDLDRLARRIERDTARSVFTVSGLD